MLDSLNIENIALIEKAEITFGPGLNVLSGETGAGKSILIGSINTALGAKVSRDIIRRETDQAYAELIFYPGEKKREELARDFDLVFDEDGQLIVTRRLTAGKTIARINGDSVPASRSAELSGYLLDLHSQKEHLSLLKLSKHLDMVDAFAGREAADLRARVHELHTEWRKLTNRLEEFRKDQADRLREYSYLEFALGEIEDAALIPGEEEELAARHRKVVNQKDVCDGLEEVLSYTESGRTSASDAVEQSLRILSHLIALDEDMTPLNDTMMDIESLLNDFNHQIRSYMDDAVYDGEELHEIEDRLDKIRELEAKYGRTIEDVLAYYEENKARFYELQHYDEILADTELALAKVTGELEKACEALTALRRSAAEQLEKRITEALIDLNFLDVIFEVELRPLPVPGAHGADEAEFMISTNPGEPVRPLRQIASGGEMSRIMLALKAVLADADDIETLIFDEIDTGISGRTAQKVAEKLHDIAGRHQVICISHLPQIVAMADHHFLIEKSAKDGDTTTKVTVLDEEESVRELARLLGGTEITETTLMGAREMRRMARGGSSE